MIAKRIEEETFDATNMATNGVIKSGASLGTFAATYSKIHRATYRETRAAAKLALEVWDDR